MDGTTVPAPPLVYGVETQQVTGDEEATKLLRCEYRKPWKHPAGEA